MNLTNKVKELSKYGELIAGDKKEKFVVDKIKAYFEEKKIDIYIYPQEVLNWKENEIEIECDGKKIDAISFPYSPSIDIETNDYKVIKVNNILEVNKYYKNTDVISIFTMDDYFRKIVIKDGKLLSHLPQKPPSIPAFYVRSRDVNKIHGKCRFYLKTSFTPSIGYTIEGIIPGKTNESIYVTAHHDHWFSGEHDNLISVVILPELSSKYELHLVSFTAEESGCYFSSFSWACGSHAFVRESNISPLITISLDNLTTNPQYFVTPGLLKYFENNISSPSPYTDSYNFLKLGIPTISVSDINYYYYHSERDIIDEKENFDEIIHKLNKFLATDIQINKYELINNIFNLPLPIEIKTLAFNLIEKGKYNELLKFYGSVLELNSGLMEACEFYKLVGLKKAYSTAIAIEDFDEIKNNCESSECQELFDKYLSYLQRETTKEYIKVLKNLF
ncbi:M28 family peptidase [Sulfurisphaera javensis]|uniref:M28 family peptidase n=1 Tax=Sulfurisphaera javensis TaxID=2049879 RepID=A0AAT9GRN7_9CREN